jgi:hypothetical protein
MKTIITTIFLFLCLVSKSQTSDVLYIPSQNSLLVAYSNNFSPLGFYVGGYYKTSFPNPYVYTTPVSFINRIGLNVNVYNNSIALMGGAYVQSFRDRLDFKPDIWIKVNPLRFLLKTNRGFDFSVGVNYMEEFRLGVGLSIPFGIYR